MPIRLAVRMVTPRGWTGGLNYLLNVCRVLRAYVSDIEPVFFAPADLDHRLVEAIAGVAGAPPIPLRERTHVNDLAALFGKSERESNIAFKAARIDVVLESTGYYGAKPTFPTLSWITDFQHRHLPHMFSYKQWLTREVRYRKIIANREHLFLSSEDAGSDLSRFYGRRPNTTSIIPFAVFMKRVPTFSDGERVRSAYGLPARFIFLPNQLWAHKNHHIVIEALGLLGGKAPTIVVTGGGDHRSPRLRQELEVRAAELGVSDKFRMLGHIPYDDILDLNVRADALLNPSLFEGWSTTVEEAKAMGTPMILSNLPVHREQVSGNAVFFDPKNAHDCAAAIEIVQKMEPREPGVQTAAILRNKEAQHIFASRLASAIRAAL